MRRTTVEVAAEQVDADDARRRQRERDRHARAGARRPSRGRADRPSSYSPAEEARAPASAPRARSISIMSSSGAARRRRPGGRARAAESSVANVVPVASTWRACWKVATTRRRSRAMETSWTTWSTTSRTRPREALHQEGHPDVRALPVGVGHGQEDRGDHQVVGGELVGGEDGAVQEVAADRVGRREQHHGEGGEGGDEGEHALATVQPPLMRAPSATALQGSYFLMASRRSLRSWRPGRPLASMLFTQSSSIGLSLAAQRWRSSGGRV